MVVMKIALCICTYKRPELLKRLLRSLQNIELGELERTDVRIIVVDNYPDGNARAVCERFSGRLPVKLDFVEETQRGSAFARNRAVDEALRSDADFVAFIDDDDLPESDWLWQLTVKRMQTQADIVFGVFPPMVNPKWPDWLKNNKLFDAPDYKNKTKYGAPNNVGVGNVLMSHEFIEGMKSYGPLFLTEFGMLGCEDADFFARAAKCGASFSRADKAAINRGYEEQRLTLFGLLKDAYRIGNCTRQLLDKYGVPDQSRRRKRKAFKKAFQALLMLPLSFYSRALLVRRLYRMSKELGVIRGRGGKK
jgi:glycosyltransferase involved in cell wall biosynthesis